MLSLKAWHRSAVSIAAEFEEVGGQPVSAQTIRRTLHQIGVHGCHPRRKPLLKTIHKKASKQVAEDMSTKHMDNWNHVLWSDEMKIDLFGSNGFKHMWRRPGEEYKDKCVMPTVKHGGGNVMAKGCMSAAGVGELYFIEENMNSNMYCEILQQSFIPSLQKLGRRAVFQHVNDPKHTFKTTIALLKRLRVKVMDWPSMSPDLNPIEHLWGILKRKVEVCKVSNICQLRNVVMEEWKNIPVATYEALVNSMPRRVKAVLHNDGYIDTSVQKGGVAGIPGRLEHTGVLTQLLREAKESKGDLTVLWLDLANVYGSMPHKLVEEALKRHHVPPSVCDLLADYYKNFWLRACSSSVTSEWQTLEKGIITGCTMSAVLFSLTMNMLVKAAELECWGPLSRSGVR